MGLWIWKLIVLLFKKKQEKKQEKNNWFSELLQMTNMFMQIIQPLYKYTADIICIRLMQGLSPIIDDFIAVFGKQPSHYNDMQNSFMKMWSEQSTCMDIYN